MGFALEAVGVEEAFAFATAGFAGMAELGAAKATELAIANKADAKADLPGKGKIFILMPLS